VGPPRQDQGRQARRSDGDPPGQSLDHQGRLDSVAPGTEGDWVSIDGVVERIAAGVVQVRGEVAFRVATVEKGTPCKVAGLLTFRRSGKSQVWRLAEGDNPCDGKREGFDLVMDKQGEKKPVPPQPKRG
jgi:hypothetical protein